MDPEKAAKELGRLFRHARIDAGYDEQQLQFAREVLGVTDSHLSRIERGEKIPSLAVMQRLADRAKADYAAMERLHRIIKGYTASDPVSAPPRIIRSHSRKEGYLPVIGKAACGNWIEAITNGREPSGEKRMEFVGQKAAQKAKAFLVEASGASMTGSGITDGDLLLVEPNAPLVNGKVALVCMKGEVTVKVWREIGDQIVLSPTNPDPKYKELVVPTEEFAREGGVAYRITGVQAFRQL